MIGDRVGRTRRRGERAFGRAVFRRPSCGRAARAEYPGVYDCCRAESRAVDLSKRVGRARVAAGNRDVEVLRNGGKTRESVRINRDRVARDRGVAACFRGSDGDFRRVEFCAAGEGELVALRVVGVGAAVVVDACVARHAREMIIVDVRAGCAVFGIDDARVGCVVVDGGSAISRICRNDISRAADDEAVVRLAIRELER